MVNYLLKVFNYKLKYYCIWRLKKTVEFDNVLLYFDSLKTVEYDNVLLYLESLKNTRR